MYRVSGTIATGHVSWFARACAPPTSWFLRVDFDPSQASWPGELERLELDLEVHRADPITHDPTEKLVQGSFGMRRATDGSFLAEFLSGDGDTAAHAPDESAATYRGIWVHELRVDPLENRVAPLLLDLRFRSQADGAVQPTADQRPYRVVLNGMQQRDRTNVARHVARTGTGQEIAILLYTNPDSQGLGMLQRIQPPYHELTSDLRLVWEYRVTAGGWVPPHEHNTEEIWYVTAGEGTYVADGEERVIRAGDAVVLYAGSWHGLLADRGDIEYLVIDVGVARANAPH